MAIPIITQPRCRVCKSRCRVEVEDALIEGLNFSAIARTIPPNIEGRHVTHRGIATHYRKHLSPVLTRIEARIEVEAFEAEVVRRWAHGGSDLVPVPSPARCPQARS